MVNSALAGVLRKVVEPLGRFSYVSGSVPLKSSLGTHGPSDQWSSGSINQSVAVNQHVNGSNIPFHNISIVFPNNLVSPNSSESTEFPNCSDSAVFPNRCDSCDSCQCSQNIFVPTAVNGELPYDRLEIKNRVKGEGSKEERRRERKEGGWMGNLLILLSVLLLNGSTVSALTTVTPQGRH